MPHARCAMADIHHRIHSMLCPEKATSMLLRSMSWSRKFLQSKQVAEQNSNIEQESSSEKEKEDAMKPLSYQDSMEANFLRELRIYVLLMATLAASVTYTLGMNTPGGFWSDNDGAHLAGDPILRVTDRRRYKVFFYFNATAFMASIVTVNFLLLQTVSRRHRRLRTLQAMLLDKFGTMAAYAALVAAILLIVGLQILMFLFMSVENWVHNVQEAARKCLKLDQTESQDHRHSALSDPQEIVDADQHLEKSKRYLLLFAILAASITYQAGLNPPGGFWQTNATDGLHQHRDGDPILHITSPRRYLVFFSCNATAFAASLVIVILLLSNIFRTQGIKYAAGSCRKSAPAEDEDDRNRPMKRSPREATWHVACAAAHHMTGNQSLLLTGGYSPAVHDGEDMFVHPATGEVRPLRVHGSGSVRTESIALDDVWYVPGLDANLVSTGQLARQGCAITLGPGGCRITRGDALVGSARFTEGNQFVLDYLKVASSM